MLAEMVPKVAEMVVVPAVRAVTKPLALIVATAVLLEVQVTRLVTSCVVPSEKVAMAVNCGVVPWGKVGLAGVTVMEDRVAVVTVRVVPPETSPKVAVMIVLPAARPLAKPLLSTVATAVLEDRHVTNVVMSSVGATENFPVAVNCWVVSTSMIGFSGVTEMEVGCPIGLPPPQVFKDTAKEPRHNMARKNLKSFISHPKEETSHALLGVTRSCIFTRFEMMQK